MYFTKFLNLFFPSQCPICSERSDSYRHNPLCLSCWDKIQKYTGPACNVCGMPSPSIETLICGICLKSPQPFSQTLYYGLYEGNLKKAIHLFKFSKIKRLAEPLGRLLLDISIPKVDMIIPVPLHLKRLRQREFNQTALIGHFLSKELGIPLSLNNLIKTKETQPQTFLNRKERLVNIKKAFFVDGISGCDILLLDDVITSGATVRECAKSLKKAGAKTVTVLALAHSTPSDMKINVYNVSDIKGPLSANGVEDLSFPAR